MHSSVRSDDQGPKPPTTDFAMPATSKVGAKDWVYRLYAPNKTGTLSVNDGSNHVLYWEEYGARDGEPVMFLHGGPGGGSDPKQSLFFDPRRYRVVLFDQRGCGKSSPSVAVDGRSALIDNTTNDLVEDINRLRGELNIASEQKMHLFGGSWGSTLAMAYAIKYPQNVATLILRAIFLGRKRDLDYLYQGNAATYDINPQEVTAPGAYVFYPEAWKAFVEFIPKEERVDMRAAYKMRFDAIPANASETKEQAKAAVIWSVWEGVISNLVPDLSNVGKFANEAFAVSFAQIESHYFKHGAVFTSPEDYLLRNVSKFAQIPMHIVHGRFDQVCPVSQAEELVAAMRREGVVPANYIKTTAGHSQFEQENYRALTAIMDQLPRLV